MFFQCFIFAVFQLRLLNFFDLEIKDIEKTRLVTFVFF